jgi:hypothetical protein
MDLSVLHKRTTNLTPIWVIILLCNIFNYFPDVQLDEQIFQLQKHERGKVKKKWSNVFICVPPLACRFFWYFIYLCDMRNLDKEKKLRFVLSTAQCMPYTYTYAMHFKLCIRVGKHRFFSELLVYLENCPPRLISLFLTMI